MGDHADWLIDRYDLEDDLRCDTGAVQCKYCDAFPLYWEETDEGWRLFDEDKDEMHQCLALTPDAGDEFTKVQKEEKDDGQ